MVAGIVGADVGVGMSVRLSVSVSRGECFRVCLNLSESMVAGAGRGASEGGVSVSTGVVCVVDRVSLGWCVGRRVDVDVVLCMSSACLVFALCMNVGARVGLSVCAGIGVCVGVGVGGCVQADVHVGRFTCMGAGVGRGVPGEGMGVDMGSVLYASVDLGTVGGVRVGVGGGLSLVENIGVGVGVDISRDVGDGGVMSAGACVGLFFDGDVGRGVGVGAGKGMDQGLSDVEGASAYLCVGVGGSGRGRGRGRGEGGVLCIHRCGCTEAVIVLFVGVGRMDACVAGSGHGCVMPVEAGAGVGSIGGCPDWGLTCRPGPHRVEEHALISSGSKVYCAVVRSVRSSFQSVLWCEGQRNVGGLAVTGIRLAWVSVKRVHCPIRAPLEDPQAWSCCALLDRAERTVHWVPFSLGTRRFYVGRVFPATMQRMHLHIRVSKDQRT
eukprot:6179154-Pleurochrysis_carterae.AAC.2